MFLFTGPQRIVAKLSRPGIRFRALPLASRISLVVLLVVALAAVFASFIADNPLTTGIPVQAPSAHHWFGTDRVGRDIFARVVYGSRYSLVIGLGSTAVAVVAGAILGSLAATSPKWGDETVMRVLDVVMSFPPIALAAVLVTVFGSSVPVLIFTIAFVYVPSLARVVRANVLAQYGEDYVAAEKVIGARRAYIVLRHVAVNCAAPVMVFATVLVAEAIIFEASLSFIGAGVQDPEPSWGNVLSYGRQILLSGGWWATFFPGLVLLITVLALNILSEGLTDASASPGAARVEPVATAVAAGATRRRHRWRCRRRSRRSRWGRWRVWRALRARRVRRVRRALRVRRARRTGRRRAGCPRRAPHPRRRAGRTTTVPTSSAASSCSPNA